MDQELIDYPRIDMPGSVAVCGVTKPLDVVLLAARCNQLFAAFMRAQAELIALVPADKGRAVEAGPAVPVSERRQTVSPLVAMLSRKQISPAQYEAARALHVLLSGLERGVVRSSLPDGCRVDGGSAGAAEHGQLMRMEMTQRWVRLQERLLGDARCGAEVETRRHVIPVLLGVVMEGQTVNMLAASGRHGRRHVIAKRLQAGLTVAADFFPGSHGSRSRGGVVHVDAVGDEQQHEAA